jgi:hypothetical protein
MMNGGALCVLRRAEEVQDVGSAPTGTAIGFAVSEEERQVLLLALAHVSLERPGWYEMLKELARKFDIADQTPVGPVHSPPPVGSSTRWPLFERFRETGNADLARAKGALKKTIETLPICCECDELATHTRFDAAGDGWPSCKAHTRVGGMLGDSEPTERKWVMSLLEVASALSSLASMPSKP